MVATVYWIGIALLRCSRAMVTVDWRERRNKARRAPSHSRETGVGQRGSNDASGMRIAKDMYLYCILRPYIA